MSHDSLIGHYSTNLELKKNVGFSTFEIDDMIPFEKETYISLINGGNSSASIDDYVDLMKEIKKKNG